MHKLVARPPINWTSYTTYLSLRNCSNLVSLDLGPERKLSSLRVLYLSGCERLENTPNFSGLSNLEYLDLEHCTSLKRLHWSIGALSRLAYLNLAHCCMLESMPALPFDSASSGGRYFQMVSTSHNHRSGLYIFNCSMAMKSYWMLVALSWIARLVEQRCHFRCGFDIVIPTNNTEFPEWYFNHQFVGGSIIKIVDSDLNDNWLGFAFCVTFDVNHNLPAIFDSSSQLLLCPLYLSFESEHAEECFSTTLRLDMDEVGPASKYYWIIYISQTHCHFANTGAHITFKARPGFTVEKWGLRMVFKQDIEATKREIHGMDNHGHGPQFHYCDKTSEPKFQLPDYRLVIKKVHESNGNSGPKIQRPYNWLLIEKEENENLEVNA